MTARARRGSGGRRQRVVATAAAALLLASGWAGAAEAAARGPAPGATPDAVDSAPEAHPAQAAREVRNLEAFTRLYGYLRWFHPSDEASAVDWERMALLGASRARAAADDAALLAALRGLFMPVAPSLRLYLAGEEPAPVPPPPAPAERWRTVAWQHEGVGLGGEVPFRSARAGRRTELDVGGSEGSVVQRLVASELRGRQVRLRAALRAEVAGEGNEAVLALYALGPGDAEMPLGERTVTAGDWMVYELTAAVPAATDSVAVSLSLRGRGRAFADQVELAVAQEGGGWLPLPVGDSGFEDAESFVWQSLTPNYPADWSRESPYAGAASLAIDDPLTVIAEPLFPALPERGEAVVAELVPGVFASVPVALSGDERLTWPPAEAAALTALQHELAGLGPAEGWSAAQPEVRLAGVVILWNVFQHFYPYFDVVAVDWAAELSVALRRALADPDAASFKTTLRLLVAAAQDGHGQAWHPTIPAGEWALLPAILDVVEGKVVVTAADRAGLLRRGDVVQAIDGTDALALLAEAERLRSGSPQWRRTSAVRRLGLGLRADAARLRLEREGSTLEVALPRAGEAPETDHVLEPIVELAGGVWYVDLTRARSEEIRARLPALAAAPGVVVDVRGYPLARSEELLRHLTDRPLQSAIFQVPQAIYPDQQRRAGWNLAGRWHLPPLAPRFAGKAVFLTGPGAFSYGEAVMGVAEGHRLGEIVGATTAGVNGVVNGHTLPGGYRFSFTGMRVLKHDGSQHHLLGIRPTVPVERTLAALRAGRDEQLEAALRLIGGAPSEP